jgi:hypothetical protein
MKKIFTRFLKVFIRKPKFFLVDNKSKCIEAFTLDGVKYFMFEDPFNMPSGRAFTALAYYEEFKMRCTSDYLKLHCKAVDKILGDPKKINLTLLFEIHRNLKERLDLVPIPEHIYKLASVVFFDESESPYAYDFQYGQKKIEQWKQKPDILDFFLSTPLTGLMPSLRSESTALKTFLPVVEEVDKMHKSKLQDIVSQ